MVLSLKWLLYSLASTKFKIRVLTTVVVPNLSVLCRHTSTCFIPGNAVFILMKFYLCHSIRFHALSYSHKVREVNASLKWSGHHVVFLVATRLLEVSSSASVYFIIISLLLQCDITADYLCGSVVWPSVWCTALHLNTDETNTVKGNVDRNFLGCDAV
jgi:hypothetical protein